MLEANTSWKGADAPFFVPTLSIIIPVHNQSNLTTACINSLLKFPPPVSFEIIVVDDGSTDDTSVVLAKLSHHHGARVRWVPNDPPHRFSRACNRGAHEARGTYLLFMNNDVEVISPGSFDPLLKILENQPGIGIVAPRLLFPNGRIQHCGKVWSLGLDGSPRPEHYLYELSGDLPEAQFGGEFLTVTGACILVRRKQFFQYGPFDERYENGWEDDDLCLSFRASGLKSWVCPESVLIHHQGGTLKAEALVMERYLTLLRSKGITLASDDHLLTGLADRAREQAERFEHAWQRNRGLFLGKWESQLLKIISVNITGNNNASLDVSPSSEPARSVTIVIVTYNSAFTLDACLDSLTKTLRPGDSVLVIDNASRDDTVYKAQARISELPLELIVNSENKGYASAGNQGIRRSRTPFVVLLNPDTVVTERWLERLLDHFGDSSIAAVGPVSNFAAGRQSVACHWNGSLPEGLGPDQAAERILQINQGKSEETALLIGFCLMLRRELPDCSVFMDERLFLGNDDLELCWRLRLHGYHLLIATDCFVYHEGQHSFRTDPEKLTGRLVQESSSALYRILETCYGPGRVPLPERIWGIDWFSAEDAVWNTRIEWNQVIFNPYPWICPLSVSEPLVSVILLTFNQWSYTEECLAALKRYTPESFEAIIVDNGSSDGTTEHLKRLAAHDRRFRLILNRENLGYSAGCNQGIRCASGKYIVLMNNDVVVTPEWLSGLMECHSSHSLAGIVGPMTNQASGIQVLANVDYQMPNGLDSYSLSFRAANRFRRVPSRRVVGFCMFFHRSLIEKIGLLDEQFGTGNYEDDDFCLRAAVAGHKNMVAGDVYLHHHGSITFKATAIDYRTQLARNAALFHEKWSRPVTDPVLGKRIALCKLRNDIEILMLDEQMEAALSALASGMERYPDDLLLQELAATVRSVAGSPPEAQPDSLAMQLVNRAQSGLIAKQTDYADALILAGFRLEPWRPEIISLVLEVAQSHPGGLANFTAQAYRLYPASRGLARLRVQLAALETIPEAIDWAEEFLAVFGPDDHVIEAGLAARRRIAPIHSKPISISLCMIVKNEEDTLARCISSCKPVVDEIVIVDTGSSDRTVKIAELFGAKLLTLPWGNDFSSARNRSLEAARGSWILVMDADEALSARDHALFRELIKTSGGLVAYTVTTRNYTGNSALEGLVPCSGEYPENEAGIGWTPSDKVRIFPSGRGVCFSGRIHEMVEPSIMNSRLVIKQFPVPVHHYGGLDQAKHRRKQLHYLELGLQKLEQNSDDPKALYELAVQATELGRFVSAESLWQNLLKAQPSFARGWFNLGYVLMRQGKLVQSIQATEQALQIEPDYQDAWVNKCICESCLFSGERAFRSATYYLERYPDHPTIISIVALAFYRIGKSKEGCRLVQLLKTKGCDCSHFFEQILDSVMKYGTSEDIPAIRHAISDATVTLFAETDSTSSAS